MKITSYLMGAAVWFMNAAAPTHAAEISVFAAASLSESLKAVAAVYEKQTGDKITINFAASGILARQIEAGAPADLFFSADEASADALEKKGLLVGESRTNRLSNSLVVVVPVDSSVKFSDIQDLAAPGIRRIALGSPQTVPAGTYAKNYLNGVKIWAGVESRIIPVENVRAVLAAVASGNVDAGFVYKTDAVISSKVRVVFEVPREKGSMIRYPMALVKGSKEAGAARKFLNFILSSEAGDVFRKFGFVVLD